MSQSDLVPRRRGYRRWRYERRRAGLSLAALKGAGRAPLQILLLEASATELNLHPGFDARAIALSAGTCEALARHGLWPRFAPTARPSPTSMSRIGATAARPGCRRWNTVWLHSAR